MEVCNVVSTASLGCSVNLAKLEQMLHITPKGFAKNLRKTSRKFSGLRVPISNPKAVCMVFKNGSVTTLGVKSMDDTYRALQQLSKLLRFCGCTPQEPANLRVRNVVGFFHIGHSLSLPSIYEQLRKRCFVIYEPELFTGMKVELDRRKLTAILFGTGKIIVTGALSVCELETAYDMILYLLRKCIK